MKRRESSKRNYYIISPRVIIKAIIIIRVSLHFTQSGLSISMAAGVVFEKIFEYILGPTGLRALDGCLQAAFLAKNN